MTIQDRLAEYRAQVAEEKTAPRTKATEASLERLRAISEENKHEAIELERFKNGLKAVIVTPENLKALLSRCSTDQSRLDRRTAKLHWWITAGYRLGIEIDSPHMILFLSNLTRDEERMTAAQFEDEWTAAAAKKRLAYRMEHGYITAEPGTVKVGRYRCAYPNCGQGRDERGRRDRARVLKRGDFCGTECRRAAKQAVKDTMRASDPNSRGYRKVESEIEVPKTCEIWGEK